MAQPPSPSSSSSNIEPENGLAQPYGEKTAGAVVESDDSSSDGRQPVPLSWKIASVVLVTAIGFGSQWSSGITAAMKSTIKKEMGITNTQFSLLEASEDFMVTALMMVSGIVTDRIGGAGKRSIRIMVTFSDDILRCHAVRKLDLLYRLYLGCRSSSNPFLQVHDSWTSRSSFGRHRNPDRPVQGILVLVCPWKWLRFDPRLRAGRRKDGCICRQVIREYHRQEDRELRLGILGRRLHEYLHQRHDCRFLLVHQGGQPQVPWHQRSGNWREVE